MSARALSVLIPAAGASTRLGQAKQLVEYKGKTLLAHMVDIAASISPLEIIVVTGAEADAVGAIIHQPGARCVHNPRWQDGLGGSIALGAGAVSPQAAGLMILLCDQYRLRQADLQTLLDGWQGAPARIAAAEAGGRHMPPLIFPSSLFNELTMLTGETGARGLLARHPERITAIAMPNAGFDLDTPGQLQNLNG